MHYALEDPEDDPFAFIFGPGAYDPSRPLVLDPSMLVDCGYIGGCDDEWTLSLAVDRAGILVFFD